MLHRGAKKGFRDYLFKDYCRGRLINNAPIYRFLCSNMTKNIQILCVPPRLAMNKLSCAIKSVWFTATAAHAACILLNPHPVSEYVLSNDATKTIKIVRLALVNIFSMWIHLDFIDKIKQNKVWLETFLTFTVVDNPEKLYIHFWPLFAPNHSTCIRGTNTTWEYFFNWQKRFYTCSVHIEQVITLIC